MSVYPLAMHWSHRLREEMEKQEMSMVDLSENSGVPYDSLNKYLRGEVDNPRGDAMAKLARALGLKEQYLRYGTLDPDTGKLESVQFAGIVAAGNWMDPAEFDQSRFDDITVPPDPSYPVSVQRAWLVQGRSVERAAKDGEILIGVLVAESGIEPQDGDLVVAERLREQGGLIERTAKRLRIFRNRIELWPQYEDDALNVPIQLDERAGEEAEVRIVAVAIGVYRPLRRPRSLA